MCSGRWIQGPVRVTVHRTVEYRTWYVQRQAGRQKTNKEKNETPCTKAAHTGLARRLSLPRGRPPAPSPPPLFLGSTMSGPLSLTRPCYGVSVFACRSLAHPPGAAFQHRGRLRGSRKQVEEKHIYSLTTTPPAYQGSRAAPTYIAAPLNCASPGHRCSSFIRPPARYWPSPWLLHTRRRRPVAYTVPQGNGSHS